MSRDDTTVVQYLKRLHIPNKPQNFRDDLDREFKVFMITTIDQKKYAASANTARQKDQEATEAAIRTLAQNLRQTPNVSALANVLAPSDAASGSSLLGELQDIDKPGGDEKDEAIVLRESMQLTRLLYQDYDWFSDTFITDDRAEVEDSLNDDIDNIIGMLKKKALIGTAAIRDINNAKDDNLKKVQIVFRILDRRRRDAILVRTIQRALRQSKDVAIFLRPGPEMKK